MHFGSAIRAVFGASRAGDVAGTADCASAHIFRIENVFFQLLFCREDCAAKVFADERVRDRLRTDTAFSVIQQKAVTVNVVAAELDQPPDTARLLWRETE